MFQCMRILLTTLLEINLNGLKLMCYLRRQKYKKDRWVFKEEVAKRKCQFTTGLEPAISDLGGQRVTGTWISVFSERKERRQPTHFST